MKTLKLTVIVLAFVAFLFASCKKDKEVPNITINQPAEHTEFQPKDMVHIEADFTDNEALSSYTLMIGDKSGNPIQGFHHNDNGNISGKSYDYHTMITVPDSLSVAMFYLHFAVTDAEGNVASAKHMLHFHQ